MKNFIQINGIYSESLLNVLIKRQVTQVGFDFRPKSFNFIQGYQFLEILSSVKGESLKVWMDFSGEKDFMIQKMLDDIKKKESIDGQIEFGVFFNDLRNPDFYKMFDLPFSFSWFEKLVFSESWDVPQLEELILDFNYLEELHNKGTLERFFIDFSKHLSSYKKSPNVSLALDWDSNIFPSLFEYFPISKFIFQINSKVENGYRNPNIDLIENCLFAIEKNFQQFLTEK